MLKHILFDNDGTIVDSEMMAARITLRHLAKHGLVMSEHTYNTRYPGLRTRDILSALEEEEGFTIPDGFLEAIHVDHRAAFDQSLEAIEGMPAIFTGLKMPKSMVSNGSVRHVKQCLQRVGLYDFFEGEIFSAEHVSQPKPSPELYRYALQKLQLLPEEALVIEDSTTGILSAKGAGIQVVGFLGASHVYPEHADALQAAGADFIASDAAALALLLKKINAF